MGKYPPHLDVQDRLISKYTRMNRSGSNNEKDPASLSLKEQFEQERLRKLNKQPENKNEYTRFANGYIEYKRKK